MKWVNRSVVGMLIMTTAACNLTQNPPTPTLRPSITPPIALTLSSGTLLPSVTPINLNTPVPGQTGGGSSTTCLAPAGWVVYVIEPGDSLGLLAEATGTTIDLLVSANCLADASLITAGQPIYLPTEPVVG
ncbi:MAG: LysM domain-containing protein [Chloroflexota bacterium]|nr:LysM domain-containing protein [Chloroflexota bacterium]